MTIRQMKSMSGWRRFVSDYGFEGICQPKNLERFSNWMLYSIGISSTFFAGCVYLNKVGEPLSYNALTKFLVFRAGCELPNSQQDIFQRGLSLCMHQEASIGSDQLMSATRRLAPIESRIQELSAFIKQLKEISQKSAASTVNELVAIVGTTGLGLPTTRVVEAAAKAAKDVRDFEQLAFKQLVSVWLSAGYFDDATYPNRRIFGSRQTSEAVGVDIGSQIVSDLQKVSIASFQNAVMSIQQWGFVVVKSCISENRLDVLRKSLSLNEESATKIGQRIVEMDKNISHSRALPNRLQLLMRGSSLEPLFQDIHGQIIPIVTSLLDRKSTNPDRVILTDIRLIVVDCAADKGNWTLMNPRGGYTVIVPLYDRDDKAGTQLLLPGSHFLADRSLYLYQKLFLAGQRYAKVKRPVAITDLFEDGCWRAGDALIMDNRLLHRSQENRRFKSGTYLLMKYETLQEAPVGMYFSGKLTYRLAGLLEKTAQWALPIA